MEAAGLGGDHDHPLEDVDALLVSSSGDPAVFVPLEEPVVHGESPGEGCGKSRGSSRRTWAMRRWRTVLMSSLDAVLVGDEEGSPVGGGSADGASTKEDEEVVGVDGDDPNGKKKRRQIRNRDSAMKSRERKKMYAKDLEMKSKYLEAECQRLSYALQCAGVCRTHGSSAAGFPALASEHRVPIPDAGSAQQKPGGSKQPRKRARNGG